MMRYALRFVLGTLCPLGFVAAGVEARAQSPSEGASEGATAEPSDPPNDEAIHPGDLAEAKGIYSRHCAACHGASGNGKGPYRRYLTVPARDFTRGEYKFRRTAFGTPPTTSDVVRTISLGVLGTEMPAWKGVLSMRERRLLALYVLSLSKVPIQPSAEKMAIEIGKAPPVDSAAIERGRALYAASGCPMCHGAEGRGDGPVGAALVDPNGSRIVPADFTRGYYKGGRGREVVVRTISTGLSGTPMVAFGAGLTPEQRWDLAAFVDSLGHVGFFEDLFGAPSGRRTAP